MTAPTLADPVLGLAAEVLDDLEKVRIANENRLRQLTRAETDKDGEDRGFGYDVDHPDVARLAALLAAMNCKSSVLKDLGWEREPKKRGVSCCLEHAAEENLVALLRKHPLAPWVKQAKGVGEKQAARLLAAIGDPYIRHEMTRPLADGTTRTEPARPRTPSELWAYAGYHVISGKAASRAKGQRANWNPDAKMRAYLVSVSILKAGGHYKDIYDKAKAHQQLAIHHDPCKRCGPSGKPAEAGTSLSDGHKHARALRAVSKAVLLDLWRESKRIHEAAA
jgi:hypothetical protein